MNENDTIFWHIANFFYIQIDSKKTCLSASNTLILHKRTRLSIDKKLLECLQLQYTSKDFTLSYHRMQTKAVPFKSISSTYSFYSRSINIKIFHRLSRVFLPTSFSLFTINYVLKFTSSYHTYAFIHARNQTE